MNRPEYLREHKEGVLLAVLAKPGSRRNELMGLHDGRLKVALRSPPVDGKANRELVSLLATITGVAKSAITIRRGLGGKKKEVLFKGVTLNFLASTLENSE